MCAIVEPWDAIHLTPIISLSRPNTLQRLQSELPGLTFTPMSNEFLLIGLNGEKYVSGQGLFANATAVAELEKLGPTL